MCPLGFLYLIIFAAQVFWLLRVCMRKRKIWPVWTVNLLCAAVSGFLMWYFDTLPGYGIMPGFAYFPEVFASLCATAAFTLLSFVTLLCLLLRKHK